MSRGHFAAGAAAIALLLAAPAAASAQSFPLVGWWPMNEGGGQTVRDWSGKGNHGTLGRTAAVEAEDPTWTRGVLFGTALSFDGNDTVTIPDASAHEPQRLTVSAWVKGSSSPGPLKYILGKGAINCDRSSYGLYTGADGGAVFYVSDSQQAYLSPAKGPELWDGKWHNVVGTYDGSKVNLFVDGVKAGPGTPGPAAIDYSLPQGPTTVGDYGNAASGCWNSLKLTGDVDGLQIWSTALPVDQIWNVLRPIVNLAR